MSSETRIQTTGTILRKGSGHSFIASLPNGKEVVAFPTRDLAEFASTLEPGADVTLELTETQVMDDPLLAHPRAIVTPHVAALTRTTYRDLCLATARGVLDVLAGREPTDGARRVGA